MNQVALFISLLSMSLKTHKVSFTIVKTVFILKLIKALTRLHYLVGFTLPKTASNVTVFLKTTAQKINPLMVGCCLISLPSRPIYWSAKRCGFKYNSSVFFLSTSYGILSHYEASALNIGGIVLFKVV